MTMRLTLFLALWATFTSAQSTPPATPAGTGIIRGRVLRGDGRPISRATVRLVGLTNHTQRVATTGSDGAYTFRDLPADSYTLSAHKLGYIELELGQQRPFERGRRLTLADSETLDKIDLTLPRVGAITGRILDENGEPLEGVTVRVLHVAFVAERRRLVDVPGAPPRLSNDLGRYRVYGVPPGQYIVIAGGASRSGRGTPGYIPTYFPSVASAADAQFVTVGGSQDVTNVDIALARGRTVRIAGNALDADGHSLTGTVMLRQRSTAITMEPRIAMVQPDGMFELRDVTPGDYVLQALGRRPPQEPPGNMPEGEFAMQYLSVNDQDVTNLSIRTSTGSTVRGRVIVEGDVATLKPSDITLDAFPTDFDLSAAGGGPPAFTRPKEDWTFELAGLHGPRRLLLWSGPPSWSLKSIRMNGIDVTDTPLPFGKKDQSLEDVEVSVTARGGRVSGSVIDARGRSVNDYTMIVYAADRARWFRNSRFMKFARAETDGTFKARGLPPGEYFVVAVDWMQGTEGDGEWQDPEFLASLMPKATRVTLGAAQHLSTTLRLIVR